eukprot:TRINITY_DN3528_c0_g1_i1.p1 TRINITY_DN3528_c0_g1~~TRINITY_DN3528_c0_g1_i1.p1  ORF type:complete len:193 (-),score=62.57 TRINITY_DN3528_c0_g1_i1:77-598(-)
MGNNSDKLRQQDIDSMLTTTAFTERELRRLFVRFQKLVETPAENLQPQQQQYYALLHRLHDMFSPSPESHFADFVASLAILSDSSPTSEDAKLRFAFQFFDADGDNYISNAELFHSLRVLLPDLTERELQEVVDRTILQVDTDGEGHLSYPEFKEFLLRNCCDIVDKLTITWQ